MQKSVVSDRLKEEEQKKLAVSCDLEEEGQKGLAAGCRLEEVGHFPEEVVFLELFFLHSSS